MADRMPHSRLGQTGLVVSRLSYGSWVSFQFQIDIEPAYAIMKRAFELGINFFDNAEGYAQGKSETLMGLCIERGLKEGVWAREDLVVSTKIFFGARGKPDNHRPNAKGLSRKHIVEGLTNSLARLRLDHVDVVFCHRPDPVTPIEETVRAMNHVIDRGMAFYWGTSEWSAQQIQEAKGIADRLGLIGPSCEQPEYNLFQRQKVEVEFDPLYRSGLGLTTWSPLASGILTGKYAGGKIPEGSRMSVQNYSFLKDAMLKNMWQIEAAERMRPIAADLGCSLAQLSIAWCLSNPRVSTVILGATKVAQLEETVASLDILSKMTPDVVSRIEDAVGPKPRPRVHHVTAQVNGIRQPSKL